ncbi:hypothetical protein PFISCL1PPCAC_2793 [Pristionchus fissidentatus]|uniref:G protein-coupled receptor n=1 Tax=Pristionchus fissidentatus TaxID=1538716 RepID=A0AAV5UYB6_9BILA|nr:hypothetical protein PFISCL1PPCAC_2793 [Pristionchus fissidentatus]
MSHLEVSLRTIDIDRYVQDLRDGFPGDLVNRWECFVFYRLSVLVIMLTIILSWWTVVLSALLYHTLSVLNEMQTISVKTKLYHQRMTKSLILQILVPLVTFVIPAAGSVLIFAAQIEAAEFAPLLLKIFSMGSIVHSLTLILSNTNLRKAVLRKLVSVSVIEEEKTTNALHSMVVKSVKK